MRSESNEQNENNNYFGDTLKKLCKEKNTSFSALASYLDISRSGISHWINGRHYPSHEHLLLIAQYFNVSVDYLLGRNNFNNDNLSPKDLKICDIPKSRIRKGQIFLEKSMNLPKKRKD